MIPTGQIWKVINCLRPRRQIISPRLWSVASPNRKKSSGSIPSIRSQRISKNRPSTGPRFAVRWKRPNTSYQSLSELKALTDREREVLDLLAQGLTNKEIAEKLIITTNTVKTTLESNLRKTGCPYAFRSNLQGQWKIGTLLTRLRNRFNFCAAFPIQPTHLRV